jgi:hypothetical protein
VYFRKNQGSGTSENMVKFHKYKTSFLFSHAIFYECIHGIIHGVETD